MTRRLNLLFVENMNIEKGIAQNAKRIYDLIKSGSLLYALAKT